MVYLLIVIARHEIQSFRSIGPVVWDIYGPPKCDISVQRGCGLLLLNHHISGTPRPIFIKLAIWLIPNISLLFRLEHVEVYWLIFIMNLKLTIRSCELDIEEPVLGDLWFGRPLILGDHNPRHGSFLTIKYLAWVITCQTRPATGSFCLTNDSFTCHERPDHADRGHFRQ